MRALGLMSGTSMDGVDACLMETDGIAAGTPLATTFVPYTPAERQILAAAMGRWPGDGGLDAAHDIILTRHLEAIGQFERVELVGFHGQTLAHDPAGRRTHQLGDGAALAKACNLPVAWDFRTQDVRAGGQGAPLAPFYHHALARTARLTAPTAILNLGGVANVSVVDPAIEAPEAPGAVCAFDTGPANALLDDFMAARTGTPRDTDGAFAARGRPHTAIIDTALAHPFFAAPPPKSLDRQAFEPTLAALETLSTEDGAATLTALTAASVAAACQHLAPPPATWLVCGGGRHNPALMAALQSHLPGEVRPVESLGWDGDMLEAQAFAWLAVRTLRSLPISAPATTGVPGPSPGGCVSYP